jgi:hypothetical protein
LFNDELKKIWKEMFVDNLRYFPGQSKTRKDSIIGASTEFSTRYFPNRPTTQNRYNFNELARFDDSDDI